MRALVLTRDRYLCKVHIDGVCIRTATHVHHLHGRGGPCAACRADIPTHLVAACAPCNLHVGAPKFGGDPKCRPMTMW